MRRLAHGGRLSFAVLLVARPGPWTAALVAASHLGIGAAPVSTSALRLRFPDRPCRLSQSSAACLSAPCPMQVCFPSGHRIARRPAKAAPEGRVMRAPCRPDQSRQVGGAWSCPDGLIETGPRKEERPPLRCNRRSWLAAGGGVAARLGRCAEGPRPGHMS